MPPTSSFRRARVAAAVAVVAALAGATVPAATASAATDPREAAISQARANVAHNTTVFGFGTGQDLVVKDVVLDADGTSHVRFDRTYQGLPVVGGDLVVHQDAKGRLKDTSRAAAHDAAVRSTVPKVPAQSGAANALSAAPGVKDAVSTPELVVWPPTARPGSPGGPPSRAPASTASRPAGSSSPTPPPASRSRPTTPSTRPPAPGTPSTPARSPSTPPPPPAATP